MKKFKVSDISVGFCLVNKNGKIIYHNDECLQFIAENSKNGIFHSGFVDLITTGRKFILSEKYKVLPKVHKKTITLTVIDLGDISQRLEIIRHDIKNLINPFGTLINEDYSGLMQEIIKTINTISVKDLLI